MTAPSFTGDKVIAAILFEGTMDGTVEGKQAPAYLWEERGVVPFVKVDKGLEEEADSVRLMKPIPGLDALLERAAGLGIYGTKMRSVINGASRSGIAAIVQQQFEIGRQISGHGLMPIIEPKVPSRRPTNRRPRKSCATKYHAQLDKLAGGSKVMLKLTIPHRARPVCAADIACPTCSVLLLCRAGIRAQEACPPAGRKKPSHDCQLFARADQ